MPLLKTFLLLVLSNLFMTLAWYGHLKKMAARHWLLVVVVSWGIALVEYLFQVPANRIGYAGGYTVAQLKILQEVVALTVFVPFSVFFLRERLSWDYLWAACCILGAVFFIFRSRWFG